jgi:ABC-type multidrug transport system fused ATPase/permease subunit
MPKSESNDNNGGFITFEGLRFFLREGWRYDKKYVIWLVLYQLVNSMIPVVAALLPKLVIDELTGAQRVERLVLYVAVFAGYLMIANALSAFFFWDGFTHRINVSAEFDLWMHERLTLADYGCLESPAFHDMQTKAKNFLTCDYHGFGYLLDCAMRIVGQTFTLLGLIAILLSLNVWFVALFVALALLCSLVESRAAKMSMQLRMGLVQTERMWMYCSGLFEKVQWAKEIRLNGIGK